MSGTRRTVPARPSLTVGSTRTPTLAMPSAFSWPVLVPYALRAPAPVNLGVRVIRVFYCFGIVRNGKSRKQYLCALQGCFVPQGALMLVVLI